jgi:hypothetical protein
MKIRSGSQAAGLTFTPMWEMILSISKTPLGFLVLGWQEQSRELHCSTTYVALYPLVLGEHEVSLVFPRLSLTPADLTQRKS